MSFDFMTPAQIEQFGPPTLANLSKAWAVSRVIASFNYAGVTIMLWDMLLTMPIEVRLLWRTKISFLKAAFLVNRYVAPSFICVNIYFLSGLAKGLTDGLCRGWFSVAAVVQIGCLASISFLFAFRLWAWYEVSARVLYALLIVWATSLITTLALVVDLAGLHNNDITHEPLLNICITTAPVVWPQWLPATLEHGIYAVFLLFNAMATPRSERRAALAIIYRDGIVFYMLTFLVCLGSLLIWRFAPRLYMGFGLYPPWMVFQIGISRLLLNVKTSQIFIARGQVVSGEETFLQSEIPLRDAVTQKQRTSCILVARDPSTGRKDEETGTDSGMHQSFFPATSASGKNQYTGEEEYQEGNRDSVGREIRRIHPNAGSLRKRFWWMYRRSEIADIHIDVMQADHEGDAWGEPVGGVKLSRLGRLDEWL